MCRYRRGHHLQPRSSHPASLSPSFALTQLRSLRSLRSAMYLLAVNCGSSSIKGKLYAIPSAKSDPLETVADLSVSNISSKGEKVKIKVTWSNGKGKDINEDGEDGGSVECEACRWRKATDGRRFTRSDVVGQALQIGFPRQGRH
jgi:hypothetical protein